MAKRIMRAFKMREISGVTRPAQVHAKAVIMKVAAPMVFGDWRKVYKLDPGAAGLAAFEQGIEADVLAYLKRDFSDKEREQLASDGSAMPDGSFPIKTTKDLKNAISAVGRASDPAAAKKHIISRAKALDAADQLPQDWTKSDASKIDLLTKALHAVAVAKDLYPSPVSGSGDDDDGAKSFNDVLEETQERDEACRIDSKMWPLYDALRCSVTSIIQDDTLADDNAKMMAIRTSVEQFMQAASDAIPQAEAELEKLLTSRHPAAAAVLKAGDAGPPSRDEGGHMADLAKEVETLKSQVTDLIKQLEAAKAADSEKDKKLQQLEADAKKTAEEARKSADELAGIKKAQEIAKTDEVIKISIPDPADATKTVIKDIRKSEVGESSFVMFKSQQDALQKSADAAALAEFTKRASDELGKLPGTPVEKGEALRAIASLPEPVRKTIEAMFKGGATAMKSLTKPIGKDGGGNADDPEVQLEGLVNKYAADNKVNKSAAYNEVLKTEDGKRLYRESLGTAKAAE